MSSIQEEKEWGKQHTLLKDRGIDDKREVIQRSKLASIAASKRNEEEEEGSGKGQRNCVFGSDVRPTWD